MTSIRKFLYAASLVVTSLSFAPTPVSAQEPAHGAFTLPHELHWQNAVVPAGDYRFSLESNGPSGMLILSRMSNSRTGFMILVNDVDNVQMTGTNQLVLDTTANGSYVRTMELPKVGVVLHFAEPAAITERQIAKAVTAPAALGQ